MNELTDRECSKRRLRPHRLGLLHASFFGLKLSRGCTTETLLSFGGTISSNVGTWVQIIAQSLLLVLQLTNSSGLALGLISFVQAAPFLIFSLVGGSTADRVDKRASCYTKLAKSCMLLRWLEFLEPF